MADTNIAEQISRITTCRSTIRDKLVDFGVANASDTLSALTTALSGIANRGAYNIEVTQGEEILIPAGYHNGNGKATVLYDWYKIEKGTYGAADLTYSSGVYSSDGIGGINITFCCTKTTDFKIKVRVSTTSCMECGYVSNLDEPFTASVSASSSNVKQSVLSSAWTGITYSSVPKGQHIVSVQTAGKTYGISATWDVAVSSSGFKDAINGSDDSGDSGSVEGVGGLITVTYVTTQNITHNLGRTPVGAVLLLHGSASNASASQMIAGVSIPDYSGYGKCNIVLSPSSRNAMTYSLGLKAPFELSETTMSTLYNVPQGSYIWSVW